MFVVFLVVVSVSLLYQSASANGIKVVDPQYKMVVLAKDTAMAGPNGANIGPDGNLYVSHVSNTSISRIDLTIMKRSYFMNPDSGLFIPDDLTYDGKGNSMSPA
jgi:sugar lactone lactonase YvrE